MLMKEKKYITALIIILVLCVVILLIRGKKVEEPGTVPYKNYNTDSKYLVISTGDFADELKKLEKKYKGVYHTLEYSMSPDVNPVNWNELGDLIFQNYMDHNGFIILHGPETLTYTASGLSFILENLNKPVVFTQKAVLGMQFISKYTVPEVVIIDENEVFRGCRSKRYKGKFISPNFPSLAERNVLKYNNVLMAPEEPLKLLPINVNNKIVVIKLFPNIKISYIMNILKVPGIYGIILETYENGYVSDDLNFLDFLNSVISQGIIIVSVSQSLDTITTPLLEEIGVISGGSMTTEAAYAKLSLIVSHVKKYDNDMVKKLIQNNMRGEI